MDGRDQKRIFVFSTSLANESAESVLAGHYPTIIAYHCAQPRTRQFLEELTKVAPYGGQPKDDRSTPKLKVNVSIPSAATMWNHHKILDFTMDGGPNKRQPIMNRFMSASGSAPIVVPSGLSNSQGYNSLVPMMPSVVNFDTVRRENPSLGACTAVPSLSGTKVPYEKLTPQQKKHREEAFATLRKIQQFLFPENPNNGGRLQ